MKLERVNENQIRCTLTKEDLEIRQIKISEIAYGSLKTKMLFKDVMQQANYELGFEAENIPLMIEAIPMSTGCLVFIITKVDNPEELDTRFSRFAPSVIEDNDYDSSDDNEEDNSYDTVIPFEDNDSSGNGENNNSATAHIELIGQDAIKNFLDNFTNGTSPENFVDLFKKISASASARNQTNSNTKINKKTPYRLYIFDDLSIVANACKIINKTFKGNSSLYKNNVNNSYYLILDKGKSDDKDFVKITHLLMEYGNIVPSLPACIAYVKEHYKCLIENNAVSGMSNF